MIDVIPAGLTGKDLFDFVVKNEGLVLHAKKSAIKRADAISYSSPAIEKSKSAVKSIFGLPSVSESATTLQIKAVINTTNYFDSHLDVHIPGLWNKSIKDNRNGFYMLERHQNDHRAVIGEGMKATAEQKQWSELGFSYPGITEALMFSGEIHKSDNEFMFSQYKAGKVKQHSVGMQYVKLVTCINDGDYPVQKENWDKYFQMVVNGKEAEEAGIFWAVLEAKIKEGSAVLFGSNDHTPTYSVSTKNEPLQGTQGEPQKTQLVSYLLNLKN